MKKKQFNTNIIFRTTKEIKDNFNKICKDNKETISFKLNKHMEEVINNNKKNKE